MDTEKSNVIDIAGDGKLIKEIISEGQGDSPKPKQEVEGILFLKIY